jgi:hypothetical protein
MGGYVNSSVTDSGRLALCFDLPFKLWFYWPSYPAQAAQPAVLGGIG